MKPLKRIKEFQKVLQVSDDTLAKTVGVPTSTLKKWIKGTAAPTAAQLRDVAIVLGSTTIELLELDDDYLAVSSFPLTEREREIGSWGHIGIQINDEPNSRWYPINSAVAGYVQEILESAPTEYAWICIPTMSARLLYINIHACDSISLLDEACDGVYGDWKQDLIQDEINSEMASAITDHILEFDFINSEQLSKKLTQLTAEENKFLDLRQTFAYFVSGAKKILDPTADVLHRTYELVDLDIGNDFLLDLSNTDTGHQLYIPARKLCLVDAPLNVYEELLEKCVDLAD